MRPACREVQALRTLCSACHEDAVFKLCRKYASGRRSADQVVLGLEALKSQNDTDNLRELALGGLTSVVPVPTLLWTWLCANTDLLGAPIQRRMLRVAAACPRCAKHLGLHVHRLRELRARVLL